MTFLAMLVVSMLIGYLAQEHKGRTGAGYAASALAAMIAVYWFLLYVIWSGGRSEILDLPFMGFALALFSVGGVGVLMLLAVASLPKKGEVAHGTK